MITINNYSVDDVSYDISSLVRAGATVTATTLTPHNLITGLTAIIEGAVETDYNGTFIVTTTGPYTFEYTIAGTPTTPATGTISVSTGTFIFVSSEPAYQRSDELSVVSITRAGATCTVTTDSDHFYNDNDFVNISGAVETDYNGDHQITVTSPTSFEYTIAGTPTTPATGTISCFANILPANATAITPPVPGPSQISVFNTATQSWALTDYLIGQVYYFAPDYEPFTQEVVGPFPDTAVTSIPLSELKLRKIDLLYAEFLKQVQKNITSGGKTFFGDSFSVESYSDLIDYDGALITKPTKMYLPNRTITTATKGELQTLRQTWTIRENQSYNVMETKLNAINAAPDESTLNAIDLTTGWPA